MAIERLTDIENQTDRELVELLQNLVRIPSWVADKPTERRQHNENGVVDFLEEWIRAHTNVQIERQKLAGGRFNLILSRGNPDLIFLAHTDTVAPSENAPYDQLAAEIHNGSIWGRGTTDMKSGIATVLQALKLVPDAENVWAFFYADEEYNFLGMKSLVKDYGELRPKLIVSSDGSDLQFGHGCRGLIEFRARVIGETGHPAKSTGRSAIMEGFRGIFEFEKHLKRYHHPKMGGTSLNITPILGGQQLPDSVGVTGYLKKVGQAANVVPDIMEFKVDIRPGSPELNVGKAIDKLQMSIQNRGLEFQIIEMVHDYGAWYTKLQDVAEFVALAAEATGISDIQIDDPGQSGYLDLQMLWEVTGRPPAFMFGGGAGNTAHTPDEHIEIESLIKERDFFKKVLEKHQK